MNVKQKLTACVLILLCPIPVFAQQQRADAVFISYMELRNLSPENHAAITGLRKQYENVLEDILRAGNEEGAFTVADAQLAAMAMIAMLTGVNTWYREGGRLSRADIEEIYLDMAQRAVSA